MLSLPTNRESTWETASSHIPLVPVLKYMILNESQSIPLFFQTYWLWQICGIDHPMPQNLYFRWYWSSYPTKTEFQKGCPVLVAVFVFIRLKSSPSCCIQNSCPFLLSLPKTPKLQNSQLTTVWRIPVSYTHLYSFPAAVQQWLVHPWPPYLVLC